MIKVTTVDPNSCLFLQNDFDAEKFWCMQEIRSKHKLVGRTIHTKLENQILVHISGEIINGNYI